MSSSGWIVLLLLSPWIVSALAHLPLAIVHHEDEDEEVEVLLADEVLAEHDAIHEHHDEDPEDRSGEESNGTAAQLAQEEVCQGCSGPAFDWLLSPTCASPDHGSQDCPKENRFVKMDVSEAKRLLQKLDTALANTQVKLPNRQELDEAIVSHDFTHHGTRFWTTLLNVSDTMAVGLFLKLQSAPDALQYLENFMSGPMDQRIVLLEEVFAVNRSQLNLDRRSDLVAYEMDGTVRTTLHRAASSKFHREVDDLRWALEVESGLLLASSCAICVVLVLLICSFRSSSSAPMSTPVTSAKAKT